MFFRAVKRLSSTLPTLLVIATLVFVLVRLVPGGPFDSARNIPPDIERQISARYHLEDPVWKQYGAWISALLLRGDLGPTFRYPNRTVNEILAEALPISAQLGSVALALAIALGVPLGVLGAVRRGTTLDRAAMLAALVGFATPSFVLAPLLIYCLALRLHVLPVGRWDGARHVVLPATCLALPVLGVVARLTRAGMLDVLDSDFVRAARAKGLSWAAVIVRHALPVGLLPTLSYLGPAASGLLVGSVIVEGIFDIPGMGRYFIEAAANRDYNLMTGVVLVYAAFLLFFNALVDIAISMIDRRVRLE
jgi:oligopeptide transport system permease protein